MKENNNDKFTRYGFAIIAVLFFIAVILILHLINLLTTYSLVTG